MTKPSERATPAVEPKVTAARSEAARSALLEAAIELLAAHGPDGVSSREVAKAAGVNYGLVHYYFGSRNELLRQAIAREMDRWGATNPDIDAEEWTPLLLGAPLPERAWRSLVHLALCWDRYADVVDDFPLMRHRLQIHRERFGDEVDEGRLKAALVASTCLQIGWLAVSNWYLASVDATDHERDVIERFVIDVERSILGQAVGDAAG
ncbi:MAG: helix-turn-helix transcriptional regulator [Actinobacteria bacterium]|nr:helix-turn-helix transcriptional regulator [Actinomycetota bacterium]